MMNPNALLQQIQSPTLRPTATVVRDRRGRVQVERSELLSKQQKQERVTCSVEAGLKRKGVVKERNNPQYEFPFVSGALYHYDAASKTWCKGAAPAVADGYGPSNLKGMKVITWNVWFSEHEWRNRFQGLVATAVESEQADIICLQEVTTRFMGQLMKYPSVQDQYHLVLSVAPKAWYGVAMLIKKSIPPPAIEIVDSMQTRMGRTTLIAGFDFGGSSFAIATAHLESLNSKATRSHQLQCIRQALAKHDNALLVGDYNITGMGPWADPEEEEEILTKNLGPEFIDWWTSVHPDKHKSSATFDSSLNTMLKATSRFADQARYDRASLRLSPHADENGPSEWQPGDIRIIGDTSIGTDHKGTEIFVSDHFGLVMELIRP